MSRKLSCLFPECKRERDQEREASAAQIHRNPQCCCCWSSTSNAEKRRWTLRYSYSEKNSLRVKRCRICIVCVCVSRPTRPQFCTQLRCVGGGWYCVRSHHQGLTWGWNAHADHMFDKCFGRNIIPDSFFLFLSPVSPRCGPLKERVLMISVGGPYSPFSQKSNYIIVTLKRKREREKEGRRQTEETLWNQSWDAAAHTEWESEKGAI